MRVVFAGTPAPAVPSLQALLASSHEVVAVLTRPDAGAGRGRALKPSPVAQVALEHEVELLRPHRPAEALDRLRELAPDCCPVVAYGHLLRPDVLEVPRLGWVNLHFSLLPAWRGAAPVQHAVIAGDEVTGATTFLLDAGMDTGPVLGTLTEAVRPRDTSADLLDRLAVAGAELLVATLDGLEAGRLDPVPQRPDGVSVAPKLEVDDARVVWTAPALAVDRLVRGCTPAPGAWTTFRGARVKLQPLEPVPDGEHATQTEADLEPGEIAVGRRDVLVGTGSVPVRLGPVQAAGKKAMAAADWARGVRPEPRERFA